MEYSLQVNNLKRDLGDFQINMSFDVPKGSTAGLIGAEGAGKTTLLKLIFNIMARNEGEISILGRNTMEMDNKLKEKTGVVFNSDVFYNGLKIKDVRAMMRMIYKSWNDTYFGKYGDKFKLRYYKTLQSVTDCERMKLLINIAFSHRTELIVLDEPFFGLTDAEREDITGTLIDFITHEDTSFLIATRCIEEIEAFTDFFLFINNGRLMLSGEKKVLEEEYVVLTVPRGVVEEHKAIARIRGEERDEMLFYKNDFECNTAGASVKKADLKDINRFALKGEIE